MAGRPTEYNEEKLTKTQDYFEKAMSSKNVIPYIEELALLLDVDDTTLINWENKKNDDGSIAYPEFFAAIKKIRSLQKLRLMQDGIGKQKGQAINIFLLKANHQMIETDKHIHDGLGIADLVKAVKNKENGK